MNIGNHIRVEVSVDNSKQQACIYFKEELVGGIISADLCVEVGDNGDELSRLKFEMYEPREIYSDEDMLHFQNEFIKEAVHFGAEIKIRSILEYPIVPTPESDPESFGKLAAACLTIAGLATLFSPKRKKAVRVVKTKTAPVSSLVERKR